MKQKLKIWNTHTPWEDSEKQWDRNAEQAAASFPLKTFKKLPNMVGITESTGKNLKWKSFKYILQHDEGGKIRKRLFKHPIRYSKTFLQSIFKKDSYKREGDFFLYGIDNTEEFRKLLHEDDTLLIIGFSYCQKPYECPSKRFSTKCIHDPEHHYCQQCFIGKAVNALPEKDCIPLFITTVHYIGEKVLQITQENPNKKVIFMITACEMTLKMFGDWGNMAGIKGVGIRLDGRICNTMRAFELSEKGTKPGLAVILESSQKRILDFIKVRTRDCVFHVYR